MNDFCQGPLSRYIHQLHRGYKCGISCRGIVNEPLKGFKVACVNAGYQVVKYNYYRLIIIRGFIKLAYQQLISLRAFQAPPLFCIPVG